MGFRTHAAATLAEARELAAEADLRLLHHRHAPARRQRHHAWSAHPAAVPADPGGGDHRLRQRPQAAVESLKAGAFDFVSKPVDLSVRCASWSTPL